MTNILAIVRAIESHCLASGLFERVNRYESKSAPGLGLTCEIWDQSGGPVALHSGLASTSARLEFWLRIMCPMLREPQEDIDVDITGATDALMSTFSEDFTLGGLVSHIDLLGSHGNPLRYDKGYLTIDRTAYRVSVITLPVIVNDAWNQSE